MKLDKLCNRTLIVRVHMVVDGIMPIMDNLYKIKILQQSHRCDEFTPTGDTYKCGFGNIKSVNLPAMSSWVVGGTVLFVRGNEMQQDNRAAVSESRECIVRALKAIILYNKTYNYNQYKKCIIFDKSVDFLKENVL
jgi:hypothetical protein